MAKDFDLSHLIPFLFLVFDADPKVPGHDGAVRTDSKFSQFNLLLAAIQHAGVHKADIRGASELLAVIIHCLLDFDTQRGGGVIVKP